MLLRSILLAAALTCWACSPSLAVEGSSAAGPIGGNDMRSAQLPPPGLYGGAVVAYAEARDFTDGNGNSIAGLDGLESRTRLGGLALLYVPELEVFGGSVGVLGFLRGGDHCGRIFETTPKKCLAGMGDPYVEASWSRFFGTIRPSQYPGAFPIAEGLTVQLGLGIVIPVGKYDKSVAQSHGLIAGNNIWDIAPLVAATYMTPPIFAEGTEFSGKLYWNNYTKNPATDYSTGSLLNLDFAITERVGRIQFGLAGLYAVQVEDDKIAGRPVAPDGRRARAMSLGLVGAYDMPEHGASIKAKWLTHVITENTVKSFGLSIGFVKKLN